MSSSFLLGSTIATVLSPQAAPSEHRSVIAAVPLGADRRAVLNAVPCSEVAYRSARLVLKVHTKNGWKAEAAADLKAETAEPGEEEAFLSARLRVGDFDHDGRREISVVRVFFPNSGGDPAILTIYRIDKGQLSVLGSIRSNQDITVRQMGKDGRTQFLNSDEIGWDMGHSEMPRWNDIYEVRGSSLKQVNAKYPSFFKKWLPKLRQTLVVHPADKDTWAYYGYALSYAGRKTTPRQAYMSVFWPARAYAKRMARHPQQYDDPQKQIADVRILLGWAKQNKPFPKAIKPYYWFGGQNLDDQPPRDYPPK